MNPWTKRWNDLKVALAPFHPRTSWDDFKHATNFSLKYRYFYAETPKVGCSTIKGLLIQAEHGQVIQYPDMDYIHHREFSPLLNAQQLVDTVAFLEDPGVTRFCFVRNPYTRLLSAWLDKIPLSSTVPPTRRC